MKTLSALILLALLASACSRDSAAPTQQVTSPQADLAAGKAIAEAKCQSCHGLDGRGTGPDIPHLGGQKEAYLLVALDGYRTGARQHAALGQLTGTLSEADVVNLAAWYASQKNTAAPIAAGGGDAIASGKAAARACFACHGEDGNSRQPGMPSLAGQHPGYLQTAMRAYTDGRRKDASMAAQVRNLDAVTLENIALYFAAQTPKATPHRGTGDVTKGEPLSGKCGACHGLQGHSADARTPSLAGQDAQYLVLAMRHYRDGQREHAEMKAMLAGMKDEDLQHIASFYAAQTPQAVRIAKPTTGQQWAERCDKCHGAADNPAMVAPYLEGQPVAYLVKALKDYREGKRRQSAMHAMGATLTDADIQAIAEHYASLPSR